MTKLYVGDVVDVSSIYKVLAVHEDKFWGSSHGGPPRTLNVCDAKLIERKGFRVGSWVKGRYSGLVVQITELKDTAAVVLGDKGPMAWIYFDMIQTTEPVAWIVSPSPNTPSWFVDFGPNQTWFNGPSAETRAKAYAAWMNGGGK